MAPVDFRMTVLVVVQHRSSLVARVEVGLLVGHRSSLGRISWTRQMPASNEVLGEAVGSLGRYIGPFYGVSLKIVSGWNVERRLE